MANYNTLKTAIQDVIRTNGNEEITGALLQDSLLSMVNSLGAGYQFMGVATPTKNPGTPDQRVYYLAGAGTYTNFGGMVVPENNIGVLYWNNAWHSSTLALPNRITFSRNSILLNGDTRLEDVGFNSAIRGDGTNLSTVRLQCIAGLTYRLYIVNPDWARDTAGSTVILSLRKYLGGAAGDYLFQVYYNQQVQPYYEFVCPEGVDYLQLGIRANTGTFVYFKLEAIQVTSFTNNLTVLGRKLIDGIGFNSSIRGGDDTLVTVNARLLKGHTYRIHIFNPSWSQTRVGIQKVIFQVRPRISGGYGSYFVEIHKGERVNPSYIFNVPDDDGYEYIQIGLRADVEEFIYFQLEDMTLEGCYGSTFNEKINAHIAMMNKYAEMFGAEDCYFGLPYGEGKVSAKGMVHIGIAALANNIVASYWGKPEYLMEIRGENERVSTIYCYISNADHYPRVAKLSDRYTILGGKSGSNTESQEYTLVIVAKSKVDDSILVGCVLNSDHFTTESSTYSVMGDLFDLLERKRAGESVDASTLECRSAYAVVLPRGGNPQNYNYNIDLMSVGKSENTILNSHSIAKILTALVASDYVDRDEYVEFTAEDDAAYSGPSGSVFYVGDKIENMDYLVSSLLNSSSRSTIVLARQVGDKIISHNKELLYSFSMIGRTAYAHSVMTWEEWLGSIDYDLWAAKSGKSLSFDSSNHLIDGDRNIVKRTGVNYLSKSDTIVPNLYYRNY